MGLKVEDIQKDISQWTGTSTSSVSAFPPTERMISINSAYRRVNQWIWQSTSDYEYHDRNYTTLPIALGNLVAGQGNYQLPSSAQKIMSVSVKDSGGEWHKLKYFDQLQLTEDYDEFESSDGLPEYFDLIGFTVQLKPAPAAGSVTISGGLKIMLSREIQEFSVNETTSEPGFDGDFHRLCSLMPSYDYMIVNSPEAIKTDRIKGLIGEYKEDLQKFYGARTQFQQSRIVPRDFQTRI